MSKKKKIKRLTKENAELRERLKYVEGYFTASNVIIKTLDVDRSGIGGFDIEKFYKCCGVNTQR